MRLHQAAVDAADPDRGDAEAAAERDQLRVDQAVQDHADRVDGRSVGHATALNHAGLHAEFRRHVVELRAAAVHEHDADAEMVQDRHLFDEGSHRPGVAERTAPGLDDEDLALVHVDVGSRAAQCPHRDSLFALVSDHRQFPLSNRCSTAIWTTMRLAASRITRLRGPSRISSATATLRRTGRQCMK